MKCPLSDYGRLPSERVGHRLKYVYNQWLLEHCQMWTFYLSHSEFRQELYFVVDRQILDKAEGVLSRLDGSK